MHPIISFFFWSSLYILLLGLSYQLSIRHNNMPSFNRFFILIGMLFSIGIGFAGHLFRPGHQPSSEALYRVQLPEIIIKASGEMEKAGSFIQDILLSQGTLIFLIISITSILLVKYLASLLFLLRKISNTGSYTPQGMKIIAIKGDYTPFSFFNRVFIPESILGHPELNQILIHEQAHARKWHSLDLIFVELLTACFWFHPMVWYFRAEIKLQHEFEADRFVLNQNVDPVGYQQLLLSHCFSGTYLPITNPFHVSLLKKRMKMMNQANKPRNLRTLAGATMAILILIAAISLQAAQQHTPFPENQISFETVLPEMADESLTDIHLQAPPAKEDAFNVVDNMPEFPDNGIEGLMAFLGESLRYPAEAFKNKEQGNVFVSFVVEKDGSLSDVKILKGVSSSLDQEAIRVVKLMPNWKPGSMKDGTVVRTQFTLPIRFVLE